MAAQIDFGFLFLFFIKKPSKQTLYKIYDLESVLTYLNPDIINQNTYDELTKLSANEYDRIIDIAYKEPFDNLDDVNKKSFGNVINQSLHELSDDEINYIFTHTTYFPIDNAENSQFVRNLLLALKRRYDWI